MKKVEKVSIDTQRQQYLKELGKYLSFLTLRRLHPSCDSIIRCENVLVQKAQASLLLVLEAVQGDSPQSQTVVPTPRALSTRAVYLCLVGVGRRLKGSEPRQKQREVGMHWILGSVTLYLQYLPSRWRVGNREEFIGLFSRKYPRAIPQCQVSLNLGFCPNKILFCEATSLQLFLFWLFIPELL